MSHKRLIDPGLISFCEGEGQLNTLQALLDAGSVASAAKKLGVDRSVVSRILCRVERRAAIQGFSPAHGWDNPVPDTHVAKGISTFTKNARGENVWVKADLRQEAYNDMVKAAISAFISEEVSQLPVAAAPLDFQDDVIPWIQIGDAHIGMLAHAAETGENFDLKIAERELLAAVFTLIDDLPPCARIVINDLGDATHYDNMEAATAASGHALDADGRHPKMLRVYSRTMRAIVDRALGKAQIVDIFINQGNHSRINDFWMRELLDVAYAHTGRVNVIENSNVFLGYRMGKTLVMVHHSDKCPPARLVGVMTTDFREDFGETEYHYIDTGHVHHHFVSKEYPGVVIESWNHLAANDKWAHESGYRSRKSITVVFRSKSYGEVGRRLLPIQQIQDAVNAAQGKRPPKRVKRATFTV